MKPRAQINDENAHPNIPAKPVSKYVQAYEQNISKSKLSQQQQDLPLRNAKSYPRTPAKSAPATRASSRALALIPSNQLPLPTPQAFGATSNFSRGRVVTFRTPPPAFDERLLNELPPLSPLPPPPPVDESPQFVHPRRSSLTSDPFPRIRVASAASSCDGSGSCGPGHCSIGNDYVNEVIGNSNPFAGRKLDIVSPEQIAVILENAMFSHKSIRDAHRFITTLGRNDVVVVGTALRCGAASVAKLVDLLVHDKAYPKNVDTSADLLTRRVPWIESKANESDMIIGRGTMDTNNRRAFLTYLSAKVIESQGLSGRASKGSAKYIVVVRHPLDMRLSYFRLIRRLYKKARNGENKRAADFDQFFVGDDFARIILAPVSAQRALPAIGSEVNSYEKNITNWIFLQQRTKDSIHFVFYEDLIHNLDNVLAEIAAFIGVDLPSVKKNTILRKFTADDPSHPVGNERVKVNGTSQRRKSGSTNKGHVKFCQYSVAQSNLRWIRAVGECFHNLPNYESFYSKCRMAPFPLSQRILKELDHFPGQAATGARRGSILGAMKDSATTSKLEIVDIDDDEASLRARKGFASASSTREFERQRRNHTRSGSTLSDNANDLFLENPHALVLEVARLHPTSYAARKEAPLLHDKRQMHSVVATHRLFKFDENASKPTKPFETGVKKQKRRRFSILRSLGLVSSKDEEVPEQSNKRRRSSYSLSGFSSISGLGRSTRGSSLAQPRYEKEVVDSDDSDNETFHGDEILDILYGSSNKS